MRFLKRLYVRRFANDVSRRMKHRLYHGLLAASEVQLAGEGAGGRG